VAPLDPVTVPAAEALGCVVTRPVVAAEAVPPFADSAMDGFAVRSADTISASPESPVALRIAGTLAAGGDPSPFNVGPDAAVRIMTGAPIPPGADAVVMVERTSVVDGGATVEIQAAAAKGDHVRPAGDDVAVGDVVVAEGEVVTPGHLGVLASVGVMTVDVVRRPRVGVLSTGDELVEGTAALRPGQIRESNRHVLLPLVADSGCVPVDLGLVRDDEHAIRASIERAAAECDALLTTGGVSMGDFDFVRTVLDELGDMRWVQIAIKPAKPFAFGVVGPRRIPVFGLPGNPVSSVVSFEVLARPALRRMGGHSTDGLDRLRVTAMADDGLQRKRDGKVHFLRVVVSYGPDHAFHARSAGGQGSHQLSALALANGLAVLGDGEGVAAGGEVEVMLLGGVARPSR
jgi:molybdopterin molybdotransferase